MKQNVKVVLVLLCLMLCSVLILCACGRNKGNNAGNNDESSTEISSDEPQNNAQNPPAQTKLATPVVTLSGDVAAWCTVEYADKYEISVSGTLFFVENSVTSRTLADGQTFKVRAIGDGASYATSDWSNEVTYTALQLPTYTVTWKNGDTVLETDTGVAAGSMPSYDGQTPTKAEDEQYVYEFSGWSPVVSAATQDAVYQAQFNAISKTRTYTVTFCDYDGTVLIEETVAFGESATAPEGLERDGYRFVGWDKSYENVTRDVIVTAKYQRTVQISFVDYDGSVIYADYIDQGSNFNDVPEDPVRTDYKFIGWSITLYKNIQEDLTVYAQYVRTYRVIFVDYDGTVLSKQNIVSGDAAAAPLENPTREGYGFIGWDVDFSNITTNTTVTAVYEINRYTVTFKDPAGRVLAVRNNVKHGYGTFAPEVSDKYFHLGTSDGQYTFAKGYSFTGWSTSFDEVTGDLTVVAVYGEEITEPIVAVGNRVVVTSEGTTATLSVYVINGDAPYGISLDMQVDPVLLKGGVPTISVNGQQLQDGSEYYDSKLSADGLYEFRWTKSNGIQSDTVATFTFTLNVSEEAGEYPLQLLDSTYIITSAFEKVTPVLISGSVTIVK